MRSRGRATAGTAIRTKSTQSKLANELDAKMEAWERENKRIRQSSHWDPRLQHEYKWLCLCGAWVCPVTFEYRVLLGTGYFTSKG